MKVILLKKRKFWWRFISLTILSPLCAIGLLLLFIQVKQGAIIQNEIAKLNQEHQGLVVVGKSQLSPFGNFPDLSIKLNDVNIYETKENAATSIMEVAHIYVGFNVWDILKGEYTIQSLLVKTGVFNIVFHENGTTNLQNALQGTAGDTSEEPLAISLKKIRLRDLDIHKLDETSNIEIETFISEAKGGFKKTNELITAHIDTALELNVLKNGDTTYIRHKHFEIHTDVTLDQKTGILSIQPSLVAMEHADFELAGSLDTKNDMTVDLSLKGKKSNFDMFIAFAPEDLIPVLEQYNNAGEIYFNALVKGPTSSGYMPYIDAEFGANEAFLENTEKQKKINDMGFKGHFTNGKERSLKTMMFSLTDMKAKLDKGNFSGSLVVSNFEEPDVDMQITSDFNLAFMVEFFNLKNIQNTSGNVSLQMNFHDIIDLAHPERALNDLNRAYFAALKIENLSITSSDFPVPLDTLNMQLIMNGKEAKVNQFEVLMGNSDIALTGFISDLPAIIHHTDIPVYTHLDITSNSIDVAELTGFSKEENKGIDEQIRNLTAGFSFKASAKDFTESRYLPRGEFFIDSLQAQLQHYPHRLHDFHVDFIIDDEDLKIVDFTGFIDDSDFHLNGLAHHYGFWFQKELNGAVALDLTFSSDLLRLEDIFSYKGENYVPKEYRHEEFEKLVLHVNTSMHYEDSTLHAIDVDLDRLTTKMHLHPMRFENFSGQVHYANEQLVINNFHGEIGRTIFDMDMNYYRGDDKAIKKRTNYLKLQANYVDFDQLFNFNPNPPENTTIIADESADIKQHAEAFNLYELPFTNMKFDVSVGHFIYHRIDLKEVIVKLRTTENHYIYVDTLAMDAAGGQFNMSGYFNGSDPNQIYMKPNLVAKNVNLDKLLFKFENFGQDHLVSENLHGRISTTIAGNIRMYPDFVPDLDQSEIHMDVEVIDGRLENYDPMSMLSDYIGDKNLKKIKFDTLQNHLDIYNGRITIPNMTIESSLGHMEFSGTQDSNHNIDYFLRIPWKTVKKAARYKLFGNKKNKDSIVEDDEIIELDPKKKVRYLNLNIYGNIADYKISLGKRKKDN
jgi:hypothetical protein